MYGQVTPQDVRDALERGAPQQEVQDLVNQLATNPPIPMERGGKTIGNALLRGLDVSGSIASDICAGSA